MNEPKIIPMQSRENLERKAQERGREELLEYLKEDLFVKMEELRKVCIAVGKPILLASFLSDLSDIAVMWYNTDTGRR